MAAVLAFGAMFLAMALTSVGNLVVALTLSLTHASSASGIPVAFAASLTLMLWGR